MVTEQTIDTKRIMKQFYLSILCLAFIAGGGISTAVQASDKADSTTNRRYVGKLDSIQKINEVIIVGNRSATERITDVYTHSSFDSVERAFEQIASSL